MLGVAIVGAEAAKFTLEGERATRELIRGYLLAYDFVVSGRCHLGGVDIWAIEEASAAGVAWHEYPPKVLRWEDGFKPRNLQIARDPRVAHAVCIAPQNYPDSYVGRREPSCHHCGTSAHVNNGGCWTVKQAIKAGKTGAVLVV